MTGVLKEWIKCMKYKCLYSNHNLEKLLKLHEYKRQNSWRLLETLMNGLTASLELTTTEKGRQQKNTLPVLWDNICQPRIISPVGLSIMTEVK